MKQNKLFQFLPILWFTIIPIVSSFSIVIYLANWSGDIDWKLTSLLLLFIASSIAMGLAIIPTTFMAISFGYLGGWKLFPVLVIAYLMASVFGYFIGKISKNELWMDYIKSKKRGEEVLSKIRNSQSPSFIFSCRLSPVLPFGITNVLMGIFKFKLKDFLLYGTLGMLPRTMLAFWLGVQSESIIKALEQKNEYPIIQISVLFLFLLSSFFILRTLKKAN